MCLSHQGCSSCQWQWGGLKAFSHGCNKTLVTYNIRHFHGISTTGIICQFQRGQLQLREVQPVDLPIDLQSPCNAAVLQRAVREWHCSGLELGKVEWPQTFSHLYLNPVPWLFPQCSLTSRSCTESLIICSCKMWENQGRGVLILCIRATEHSHLEPPACAFQISDQHQAVLFSSHLHLPPCWGCSYKPNPKASLPLVQCQSRPGCAEEHASLLMSYGFSHFAPSFLYCCPPTSARSCAV